MDGVKNLSDGPDGREDGVVGEGEVLIDGLDGGIRVSAQKLALRTMGLVANALREGADGAHAVDLSREEFEPPRPEEA